MKSAEFDSPFSGGGGWVGGSLVVYVGSNLVRFFEAEIKTKRTELAWEDSSERNMEKTRKG